VGFKGLHDASFSRRKGSNDTGVFNDILDRSFLIGKY
jgi:hypothetical protein